MDSANSTFSRQERRRGDFLDGDRHGYDRRIDRPLSCLACHREITILRDEVFVSVGRTH